ncbi:hypothetical protein ACHQM5_000638 [Ranunculus cassubicifolius]
MASLLSSSSIDTSHPFSPNKPLILPRTHRPQTFTLHCTKKTQTTTTRTAKEGPDSDKNALIKLAWYSSELLGIAASFFRSPATASSSPKRNLIEQETAILDRKQIMESIKDDFQRSYFITGDLTLAAYEEDCEFADPAASFKGLQRFKRNCTNFGSLIEKSNMKLTKWEEFEDKGIGHWTFSCVMVFPWRPILSATGYTEYYFDPQSGKICRHAEFWNVPKMALLKQLLRPGPRKTSI